MALDIDWAGNIVLDYTGDVESVVVAVDLHVEDIVDSLFSLPYSHFLLSLFSTLETPGNYQF